MARATDRVMTETRPVAPCPMCKAEVTAEVTFAVTIGDVTMVDGEAKVETAVEMRRCTFRHSCDGTVPSPEADAAEPAAEVTA